MIDVKPIVWCGDSLRSVRAFPDDARRESGHQLNRLQQGFDPKDWKPMTTVGPGVREIRIRLEGQFRILYIANLPDAVYVLCAFEKKSQKTPQRELQLATNRLHLVLEERRRQRR
jgi:phage-related protein